MKPHWDDNLSNEWRTKNRESLLAFLKGCSLSEVGDKIAQFIQRGGEIF
jgi:hypothetical protein